MPCCHHKNTVMRVLLPCHGVSAALAVFSVTGPFLPISLLSMINRSLIKLQIGLGRKRGGRETCLCTGLMSVNLTIMWCLTCTLVCLWLSVSALCNNSCWGNTTLCAHCKRLFMPKSCLVSYFPLPISSRAGLLFQISAFS